MKIIYAVGNRVSGAIRLSRFLKNIDNKHEIKIAGYSESTYLISHVEWILNSISLTKLAFKNSLYSAKYNQDYISNIIKDVIEFDPDLIISDDEYVFSLMANELNIPLWYCSPLNMIDGIKWEEKHIYSYFFFHHKRYKFPKADEYLIYSPFCDIENPPKLKENYNWVRPYYENCSHYLIENIERKEKLDSIIKYVKLKDDYFFTDGNTDYISDAIYNNKKIIITPSINNVDSLINSVLVEKYNIGYNLGQIELMNMLAIEEIEKAYNKTYDEIVLNNEQYLQLHEKVEEYALTL